MSPDRSPEKMAAPSCTVEVETFFDDLDRWASHEDALVDRGMPVPLEHRSSWIREVSGTDCWFLVSRPDGSQPTAGVAAERSPTRSLPGHYLLRTTRFGSGVALSDLHALLSELKALVDTRPHLLSVSVELFESDPDRRTDIEASALGLGFVPASSAQRYRHTARLQLSGDEEALFSSFSASCRRCIREPTRKGFRVDLVDDSRWSPRMAEIWRETFVRTHAAPPPRDWQKRILFARNHPDLFRIVGTFGPGYPSTDSLVAFACAMNNGDHAVYNDGASTRDVDTNVALSYAPVWDLIRWSKAQGCAWFDMGGISEGTYQDSDDPRGGISDFKRRFTEDVIEVGREWTYRSPTIRSWLSQTIRSSASALRGLVRRLEPDGS